MAKLKTLTLPEIRALSEAELEKYYKTYRRRLRDAQNRLRKAGYEPRQTLPPTYLKIKGDRRSAEYELKALVSIVSSGAETLRGARELDKKARQFVDEKGLGDIIRTKRELYAFWEFLNYMGDMQIPDYDSGQVILYTKDNPDAVKEMEGAIDAGGRAEIQERFELWRQRQPW